MILTLALVLGLAAAPSVEAPNAEAEFQRGVSALARGDLATAEAALLEALRLAPGDARVYLTLGEVYKRQQKVFLSLASFRKGIEVEPDGAEGYLALAALQLELERPHDAERTLQMLLGRNPEAAEGWLLMGRVAAKRNAWAEAEPPLRRYLELRPDDVQGRVELGVVLLAQEKTGEGETLLKAALSADANSGPAHYNLGMFYSRAGEDAKARAHLEAATRLLPERAEPFHALGTVLARAGESAAAEAALRRALELAPDSAEASYALAQLLRRAGRGEEAAAAWESYQRGSAERQEAEQRAKKNSVLHGQVKTLLEEDRLAEAEGMLEEILELDSGDHLAYYRLAQIAFLRREDEEALGAIGEALGRNEVEPAYHFLQAMSLERLGQGEPAARAYERVVALADYAEAHAGLGRLALLRGDARSAVKSWRRAVELEPENPEFRVELADALELAGERTESERQRAEARALQKSGRPR